MSNFKRAMTQAILPLITANMMLASSGERYYGFNETHYARPTTEEERKFVDKQGYKRPSTRTKDDRAEQYRKRLKRKTKKYKGHKHGGARK